MSLSLVAACLWAAIATFVAMLPSRDHHWRAAYALIAVGIPARVVGQRGQRGQGDGVRT